MNLKLPETPDELNKLIIDSYNADTDKAKESLKEVTRFFEYSIASYNYLIDTILMPNVDHKTINFCLKMMEKLIKNNYENNEQCKHFINEVLMENLNIFLGKDYLIASLGKLFCVLFENDVLNGINIIYALIMDKKYDNLLIGLSLFQDFICKTNDFQQIQKIMKIDIDVLFDNNTPVNIHSLCINCFFLWLKKFPKCKLINNFLLNGNGINGFDKIIIESPTSISVRLIKLLSKLIDVENDNQKHLLFDTVNLVIYLLNDSNTRILQYQEISFLLLKLKSMIDIPEIMKNDLYFNYINSIFAFSKKILVQKKIINNNYLMDNIINFWFQKINYINFDKQKRVQYENFQYQIKELLINSIMLESELQCQIIKSISSDCSLSFPIILGEYLSLNYEEESNNLIRYFDFIDNCGLIVIINIISYFIQNHNLKYKNSLYLECDHHILETILNFTNTIKVDDKKIKNDSLLFYLISSICNYLKEFSFIYLNEKDIYEPNVILFFELLKFLINILKIKKQNKLLLEKIVSVFDFQKNVYNFIDQQFIEFLKECNFSFMFERKYKNESANFLRFLYCISNSINDYQLIQPYLNSYENFVAIFHEANIKKLNNLFIYYTKNETNIINGSKFISEISKIDFYSKLTLDSLELIKKVIKYSNYILSNYNTNVEISIYLSKTLNNLLSHNSLNFGVFSYYGDTFFNDFVSRYFNFFAYNIYEDERYIHNTIILIQKIVLSDLKINSIDDMILLFLKISAIYLSKAQIIFEDCEMISDLSIHFFKIANISKIQQNLLNNLLISSLMFITSSQPIPDQFYVFIFELIKYTYELFISILKEISVSFDEDVIDYIKYTFESTYENNENKTMDDYLKKQFMDCFSIIEDQLSSYLLLS